MPSIGSLFSMSAHIKGHSSSKKTPTFSFPASPSARATARTPTSAAKSGLGHCPCHPQGPGTQCHLAGGCRSLCPWKRSFGTFSHPAVGLGENSSGFRSAGCSPSTTNKPNASSRSCQRSAASRALIKAAKLSVCRIRA